MTVFAFQSDRDLERYVEDFVDICHQATCDDICLMEGFLCCLSDLGCELATAIPVGILVEFYTGEDWLIDWNTEILPPTLIFVPFLHHLWL